MEQIARWVFNVSWQAGALIGLVLILRWIMGRHLTPAWRCALWVVVGIRLVTPGVVGVPGPRGDVTSVTPAAAANRGVTVTVTKFWDELTLPTNHGSEEPEARATNWRAVFAWVWIGGAALVLGKLVVSNARLRRRVRAMARVTDEDVLRVVRTCAAEMGVTRDVRVVETGDVRSPAVWGVWRPVVMLPAGCDLDRDDLRMVLLHEMAHIRRGDVWVEWVAGALKSMHWFNPLVWIAATAYRSDRELACDQAVLRLIGAGRERDYGNCLLRVVEAVGRMRPEPSAVGVFGSKLNLRRRIDMIAAHRGPRPAAWSLVGLAAFAAVGCAAMTGAKGTTGVAPATGPAADAVAGTQATTRSASPLDRKLPELFLCDAPFAGVIDQLHDGTGLNFVVNWPALEAAGVSRDTPVTTRLRSVRLSKVLETILRDVGGGRVELRYVESGGVVRISTRRDMPEETVTRVYDIRDLLMDIPDFTGPQTDIGPTRAPATRPSMTRKERLDQIVGLLKRSVVPSSWRDRGGVEGTIRELSGQLIVTQTAERQREVQALLDMLREPRGLQITVEAFYLDVDPKLLKRMGVTQPAEPSRANGSDPRPPMIEPTLTNDTVAMLLKAARESSGATLLTAPRLTMLNGQRARVTVGEPVEYVADYTVVKVNDGERRYEPVKRTATSGIVTEVKPVVSSDRKSVTLSVDTTMTKVMKMAGFTFSTPGGHENLPLWEPVASTMAVRTTVSVPAGQTLVMVGSAAAADGAGAGEGRAGWVRLILFKPTVVVREAAGRQG